MGCVLWLLAVMWGLLYVALQMVGLETEHASLMGMIALVGAIICDKIEAR